MIPATIIFDVSNNEAWLDSFTLAYDDGTAFDFGDYTPVTMQIRAAEFHPEHSLDLSEGDGLTIETDGALTINVAVADMTDLNGEYHHDIIGTIGGSLQVIAKGIVRVRQGITY